MTSSSDERGMRILIDPGDFDCNMGDVAMLQVTVDRLRRLWPDATLQIITSNPDRLIAYCPQTEPLSAGGRYIWHSESCVPGCLHGAMPMAVSRTLRGLERRLRRRWPGCASLTLRAKLKLRRRGDADLQSFLDAVRKADLVLVSGGGGITDAFCSDACSVMDTLDMAIRRGTPTAMLGQGIGPIQRPDLRARARTVLPRVDLIALRERRAGLPLLQALGVADDRVATSGDDAVEIAYAARSKDLGRGMGVNLRVASYSNVDEGDIARIRFVLQEVVGRYRTTMVPIPISRYYGGEDAQIIQRLMARCGDDACGGQELDTPLKVIRQVGRCRVVVAGSYHAAVFALAQGIPVVGLVKSAYYADKFLGLADQFGSGCEVLFLDDPDLGPKLADAIDTAWRSAEEVRPKLLAVAVRQMEQSRAAYERLYQLLVSQSAAT